MVIVDSTDGRLNQNKSDKSCIYYVVVAMYVDAEQLPSKPAVLETACKPWSEGKGKGGGRGGGGGRELSN